MGLLAGLVLLPLLWCVIFCCWDRLTSWLEHKWLPWFLKPAKCIHMHLTENISTHYPRHCHVIKRLKGWEMCNCCQSSVKMSVITHLRDGFCFCCLIQQIVDLLKEILEDIVGNVVRYIQLLSTTSAFPASQKHGKESGKGKKKTIQHITAHVFIYILPSKVQPVLKPPVNPACQFVGTWLPRLASSRKQRNKSWSYIHAPVDLLLFCDQRWMVPLFLKSHAVVVPGRQPGMSAALS